MKRKYVKPSAAKKIVQRYKRNAPSFVVDMLDFFYRLPDGGKLKYPYCGGGDAYQPFFIIGSGRSGNTLLRKLLMERAGVVIPPEIPGLGSTIRRFSQLGSKSWPEIVEGVCSEFQRLANIDIETKDFAEDPIVYNLSNELDIRFDKVKKELETISESERSLERIISAIYQDYSLRMFGEVLPWGDKTPWNVFHYERIKKVFPNARYIHMLRDGRDCVASYIETLGQQKNISVEDASHRWRDSVSKCLKIEGVARKESFLTVRYEELVLNPDFEMDRVIDFLQIQADNQKRGRVVSMGDGHLSHHSNLSNPVSGGSINKWRRRLNSKEVVCMESIIGEVLMLSGYDCDN